ncbi:response regulator transcription factor [Tamlana sp. 2_MG-2023]|uniref:response regulator n=1 Tax=unclassified Tamlana TaxID=2614803 RepID=UPI0026E307E3|nr:MULTISPECIES: response regulator transcription factor [unclassified Tamlana]MDO6760087.1 response regulator transcription factor [Tamlana sp. 2_MG-2023]MDO6790215.1 response regulator transcription factor [Tamlana sp. 1_MG-2023]
MQNLNKNATIIVADDHPLLLKGMVETLESKDYQVTGKAETGLDALNLIIQQQPTIAILDIEMPILSGIEVIKKAKANHSPTKFILLTSYKEQRIILEAEQLQIQGYLLKDEPFEELDHCLQEVLKGGTYFSKTFNEVLDEDINPQLKKIKRLTPSERTILRLIAQGYTSGKISNELSVSVRTVEKHRSNIIHKLDLASNNTSLAFWSEKYKAFILGL